MVVVTTTEATTADIEHKTISPKETKKVSPKEAVRSRDSNNKPKLTRKSLTNKGPLRAPSMPGMVRRYGNDTVNRIEDLKDLGYEHVLDEKGNPIYRMTRNSEGAFKIFLMQTPDELFEVGLKEKARIVRETQEAMSEPDPHTGQYGADLSITKNK